MIKIEYNRNGRKGKIWSWKLQVTTRQGGSHGMESATDRGLQERSCL